MRKVVPDLVHPSGEAGRGALSTGWQAGWLKPERAIRYSIR